MLKRKLKFIIPLVLFVALAGFLAAGLKLDPREVPSPLIGKPAPEFKLALLHEESRSISRADMLGKPWILNVWASWCAACQIEHPLLMQYARIKQVPLIGLNYKDTRPNGQAWLARHGNPYDASLFDQDGRLGIDFGVYGAPETFVIDKTGVIRFKHIGPLTPEVIEKRIDPLLKELQG